MVKLKRVLIKSASDNIGKEIKLCGWVRLRRDHGKLIFLDIRDRSGIIQVVVNPKVSEKAYKASSELKPEYVVEVIGKVNKRPSGTVNSGLKTGDVEIEAVDIKTVSKADTLPFDMGSEELNLELPTLLDHRSLTLRYPKIATIFKFQDALAEGFRIAAKDIGCTEIFAPTISASATEGGAELFKVDYYGKKTYLVQSPQLYKQIMVGVFERVFLTSHIYRAEPSITTRHLSESIQLDCEIGFIEEFEELLNYLELVFSKTIEYAQDKYKEELQSMGVEKSKVKGVIPRLTMNEAQEIIFKRTGVDHRKELDLMPEDEREIGKWALEKHDSDLVTITHFPTKKRAFYSKPDPKTPELSLSYDLIYKGAEIASGAQRVDSYDDLIKIIKERDMNPDNFKMYLQAFKYGMPSHGGFSYGLERTTMKFLNLKNIREASLFPRDMDRVDERFSKINK